MAFNKGFDTAARTQRHAPGLAITAMIIAGVLVTLNNVATKAISFDMPVSEIVALRSISVLALLLGALATRPGGFHDLRVKQPLYHLGRGLLMAISMFAFIGALRAMPMVDVQAIVFIGPLIVTALAPLMLGEKVGWHRWIAVLVGFAGVIVMLRPSSAGLNFLALLPLCSACTTALRDIMTRRMSANDTSIAIEFYTQAIVAIVAFSALPFGWTVPTAIDLVFVLLSAVTLAGGHFLLIEALRFAETTAVAPFRYLMLLWIGVTGLIFFGEVPDVWALTGSALIVASGCYAIDHEARRQPNNP
ncbi:MAG: DMT family transporter [Alphaproteobacteria bacterium]|nr:DMT family transporter [Alphaproteobacteria bacterium]